MSDDNKPDAPEQLDALPTDLQAEGDALLAEASVGETDAPTQPTDQAASFDTAAMMSQVLAITFNGVLAPKRGEHWAMNETECEQLGKAYGAVIDKYFPDLDVGVEFTAILITFTVIGPRIAQDVVNAQTQGDETVEGEQ